MAGWQKPHVRRLVCNKRNQWLFVPSEGSDFEAALAKPLQAVEAVKVTQVEVLSLLGGQHTHYKKTIANGFLHHMGHCGEFLVRHPGYKQGSTHGCTRLSTLLMFWNYANVHFSLGWRCSWHRHKTSFFLTPSRKEKRNETIISKNVWCRAGGPGTRKGVMSFIADCLLRQFAYSDTMEVFLRLHNLCKELIKMSHGRSGTTLNSMWEGSGSNSQLCCLPAESFRLLSASFLFIIIYFIFFLAFLLLL